MNNSNQLHCIRAAVNAQSAQITGFNSQVLTNETNITHKQRKLLNDGRLFKGSNEHENGYQWVPKNDIRFSCVGLCGTRLTGP